MDTNTATVEVDAQGTRIVLEDAPGELVLGSATAEIVVETSTSQVVIEAQPTRTLDIAAVGPQGPRGEQGPQGPQGVPGTAAIGGLPTEITDIQPGDLLIFSGSVWVNENKTTISDGGNF